MRRRHPLFMDAVLLPPYSDPDFSKAPRRRTSSSWPNSDIELIRRGIQPPNRSVSLPGTELVEWEIVDVGWSAEVRSEGGGGGVEGGA